MMKMTPMQIVIYVYMSSAGIPAETALEQRLDERFPDARMERIYPNAILVD